MSQNIGEIPGTISKMQKMNESSSNDSSTQSSEDHKVPEKRQKLDTISSSKLNPPDNNSLLASEWEKSCLMNKLTTYRTRLSETEASATQIHKMRKEMERAIVEKEEMLSIQAKLDREMLKYLQNRLETVTRRTQEDNKPHSTVETEKPPVKSKIRKKMDSLFTKNPILPKHVMSSNSETTPLSPKAEEWMEIKLEEIFKEHMEIQDSDEESTQNEQVDIQMQESKPVNSEKVIPERIKAVLGARENDLEEQLQSANSMISTLREAVKEILIPEETVAGAVEQPLVNDKCEASSSKLHGNGTRGTETSSAASTPETSCLQQREGTLRQETDNQRSLLHDQEKANGESSRTRVESKEMERNVMRKAGEIDSAAVENQSSLAANSNNDSQTQGKTSSQHVNDQNEGQQNLHLSVSGFQILVSHPKFFTIEWNKYYQKSIDSMYACTKCREQRTAKLLIIDHVWVEHLGGSFVCPHCPVESNLLFTRCNIRRHMNKYHSDEFSSNPQVNDQQKNQRRTHKHAKHRKQWERM